MNTLASWNAQPIAETATQVQSARWRWKPAFLTGIFAVLIGTIVFTVAIRVVSVWNLTAMDNSVESRTQVRDEIVRWINQRPASSGKASVVACGSIERSILQPRSWVEAMIDDPSKPVDARISICRFTLDSSGSIIHMVEKGIPGNIPR